MQRRVHVDAERRKRLRRPAAVERGERVAARVSLVRIGKASGRGVGDGDLRAPGRVVREACVEEQMRRVVEDAPRRPHARPLVTLRRPDHADPRRELQLLPERRRIVRIARVAREHQARRRLRIHGAAHVLVEPRLIEVAHPRIGVRHRQERLPAEPQIDRDVRPDAPVVLRVDADVFAVVVVVDRVPLEEAAAHRADHEVGHRQARRLPVERELAVGRPVVDRLDPRMNPVAADRQLVCAADEVEVVGDLESWSS